MTDEETRPAWLKDSGARSGGLLGLAPDVLASIVLGVLVILTCADVIGRELFNSPIPGTVDLTRILLVILVLTVLPLVSFREEHISVDLVDMIYPERLVPMRQAIINLAGGIFLAVMARRVYLHAIQDLNMNRVYDDLRVSIAPVTYFVSILIALTAVVMLINAMRHIVQQVYQARDDEDETRRRGTGL